MEAAPSFLAVIAVVCALFGEDPCVLAARNLAAGPPLPKARSSRPRARAPKKAPPEDTSQFNFDEPILEALAIGPRSLPQYAKAVRDFVEDAMMHGRTAKGAGSLDKMLSRYMDRQCFQSRAGVNKGLKLMAGISHFLPEVGASLYRSRRALKGWLKHRPLGEGGPLATSTIATLVDTMIRDGYLEEGIGTLLAEDCYLRESEWLQRVPSDFSLHRDEVAIEIADPASGSTAKTAGSQGVLVESSVLKAILREVVKVVHPSTPVFQTDSTRLRRVWWHSVQRTGSEKAVGPVHSVRHSKPAADALYGRRSLEGVRRRGRWKSLTSVARYTKTYLLTKHSSLAPSRVQQHGEKLVQNRLAGLANAMLASGRKDPWAKAVLRGLMGPRAHLPDGLAREEEVVPRAQADRLALTKEAHKRGLPLSGTRAQTIARLEAAGQSQSRFARRKT